MTGAEWSIPARTKEGRNLVYLSFTENGMELACKIAAALGGRASRCGKGLSLSEWTAENFSRADGLVFVGAAGIAVRAIAPHVNSKAIDPAVVVIDEGGNYAVSLLSGHLGGGNDLARQVAAVCGAQPVITTATDVNDVFAVDEWAKHQGCHVAEPHEIKMVSAALLRGEIVGIRCFAEIAGQPPDGVRQTADEETCQVLVDIHDGKTGGCRSGSEAEAAGRLLRLIPRIAVLGIGCRRGISCQQMEESFRQLIEDTGLSEQAFCAAASIDLKKDEEGLLEFCRVHDLPLLTFTAEALKQAEGDFSTSEFVKDITGVDNVCERSAVLAAKGKLYERKRAVCGVTMAVALKPYRPDWSWKYE